MEEPGRLQSMGSQRVGYDWVTSLSLFTFMHWRRKWQPTPAWWAAVYGVTQSRTRLKWLSSSSLYTLCLLYPIGFMKTGVMPCQYYISCKTRLDTVDSSTFLLLSKDLSSVKQVYLLFFSPSPGNPFFHGPASFLWLLILQKIEHSLGSQTD